MCCNTQTHVKVIATICLALTLGLGSLHVFVTIDGSWAGWMAFELTQAFEVKYLYGGNTGLAVGIQLLIYGWSIVAEFLCLVGAIKNNKYLLIPIMGFQVIIMIGIIGAGILMVLAVLKLWIWPFFLVFDMDMDKYIYVMDIAIPFLLVYWLLFWLFLLLWLLVLLLKIYFFVIVKQFYNELSRRIPSEQMVLQNVEGM